MLKHKWARFGMSNRNRTYIIIIIVAAFSGAAYLYFRNLSKTEAEPLDQQEGTISKVQTVTLKRSKIYENLVVYGTVVAAPGKTQIFSVPFESQVREVLVTAGEEVNVNTPLVKISPSPDTLLQLAQANAEKDASRNNLDLTKQRLDLKLATRQDLIAAQQRLDTAQLNIKSMEQRGINGEQIIRATSKGMVSKIDIEQGQIVPAGSPMIETIGQNQISVRLGVENEDVGFLKPDQAVQLFQVNTPQKKAITGEISSITRRVNPETRMVDVFVTPEADANLMLNEYMEARIGIKSDTGFVVPKFAVLPESGSYVLFTVETGHAVKHIVRIGLENGEQIEVFGNDLKENQQAVVVGNYELKDNMAVEVVRKQ
jgi:membrane fusion protein (multidrug efflux system)